MISATTGTWVNYMTTLAFQVLFAARYGATPEAAAFVITFGLAVAGGGVLVGTVQSIAVPRLIAPGGELMKGTLRFVVYLTLAALALAAVLALTATPLAGWLAPALALQKAQFAALLRATAAFMLLRFAAGTLGAIGLARGHRFIPAVSPTIFSLVAAVPMLLHRGLSVEVVYWLLVAGSAVELLLLAATVIRPLRLSSEVAPSATSAAIVMLGAFMLVALIPPLERTLTALHTPADAARYDYAIRSLRSGQQLLVGGLFLATLGDWSSLVSAGQRARLQHSLAVITGLATLVLLLAASVALVAIHDIVRLVYQHGNFTPTDTNAVATIVLLGLPGFVAESLVLVQSSALAAVKRNDLLAFNGVVRFIGSVILLAALAPRLGANGAAIAYSVTAVVGLALIEFQLHVLDLWPAHGGALLGRYVPLAGGTVGTAMLLYLLAGSAPALFRAALVSVVFLALLYPARPLQTLRTLRV